ncbi:MAG: Transcriptional regulatory protein DegU [Syntrophomonadaceae bacterium]|nr:Transcriptional regulatory protein DegU [Bacillota bacterium]
MSTEKIKVLIVDDIQQTRKDIARLLYFEEDLEVIGEAADAAEALQKIGGLSPDIVLMDINMPGMDGITATEHAGRLYPGVAVIIISIQGEAEYLKKAMVSGARDYLTKPLNSEEMAATIRNVYRSQKQRQIPAAAEKLSVLPPPPPPKEKPSGVLSVIFCGKGGLGKTTVSVNLAVALAQQLRPKVVLVDLDLSFGDVGVVLNLTEGKTIYDLLRENSPFTPEILGNYLLRHFSGIDILPAPLSPQDAEYISAGQVAGLLKALQEQYDYVIVDTPANFQEINLQVLELADEILMLLTRDIAAIKNTRTCLSIFDSLHLRGKIRFVLNRCEQNLGVEVPELEKSLGITVYHQLPGDDRTVPVSLNKGIPFMVSSPQAEISRSFRRLAGRLANGRSHVNSEEKQGRKLLLNRIFSL